MLETERAKPVQLYHTPVSHDPVKGLPAISLKFISGGGPFNEIDYRVVGGPDDGKRVRVFHWVPEHTLADAHIKYNGPQEEFDSYLGFKARPGFCCTDGLNVITVAYIQGWLASGRDHAVSAEHTRLLDLAGGEGPLV